MAIRFAELTAPGVREAVHSNPLVVLPLGCTEQHAFHLPLDTDTYQVERLAVESAALAGKEYATSVLVLPTLPFGPATEHFGFPAISLSNQTWMAVVGEVIWSVIDMGFRRIAVLRGCGGHWAAPGLLWDIKAEAARRNIPVVLRVLDVDRDWRRLSETYFGGSSGGHAGAMETALCLAGRSHLVDKDAMVPPKVGDLEERYRYGGEVFLFNEMSSTGGLGDPSSASADAGEKIWCEVIESLAQTFARVDKQDRSLNRL